VPQNSGYVVLNLTQSDTLITGTATVRSAPYNVSGAYHPPRVRLVLSPASVYTGIPGVNPGYYSLDGTAVSPATMQLVVGTGPATQFRKQ
jgi:hypothetical protein